MIPVENKSIVIVAHKFLTQPDDDLVLFLNQEKYGNVLHIRHSFSDASDRSSYFTWYKNGGVYKEGKTGDYKHFSESLIYIKECYFTFKWVWQSKINWNTYIGMDGLCVLFGNILKSLKRITKTIYWAIDFVPQKRFNSAIKNKMYHWVNRHGYKNSDEMWDLSPRMAAARKKFIGFDISSYKAHKMVPYGVWIDRIKKYSYEECEKTTLVFMGHLLEKQGVQLIIRAIPEIVKTMPDFRFKIIGGGAYKEQLVNCAKALDVLQYCSFLGKMDDIKDVEDAIAKSAVAIAPYLKALDTWTYYADPGKVKTYLACGVPVLLTDIPWNAQEIARRGCGEIIPEDENTIAEKVIHFMNPEKNQLFRERALAYARTYDYNVIFQNITWR